MSRDKKNTRQNENEKSIIAENNQTSKSKILTILSIPCNNTFIILPDKVKEFKNLKPKAEIIQKMKECAKKFEMNNLVNKGPVITKTLNQTKNKSHMLSIDYERNSQ